MYYKVYEKWLFIPLEEMADYVFGSLDEAIKEFKKAVALDPFYSEAFLNMSKSYYALDDMEYAHFYIIKYFETDQYRDYMYKYRLDYQLVSW